MLHPMDENCLNPYLQLIKALESGGNSEVIYPLLQENQALLDNNFATVLDNWAKATLAQAEPEQAKEIATKICDFSILIQRFPLGNRGINLEIAITGYEVITTVFTRDRFPEDWARTQNNLGNAYLNRIRGERADNLETAIACYQEALTVSFFNSEKSYISIYNNA
jgi:tetratricopeptide (TPR) repeat protein